MYIYIYSNWTEDIDSRFFFVFFFGGYVIVIVVLMPLKCSGYQSMKRRFFYIDIFGLLCCGFEIRKETILIYSEPSRLDGKFPFFKWISLNIIYTPWDLKKKNSKRIIKPSFFVLRKFCQSFLSIRKMISNSF